MFWSTRQILKAYREEGFVSMEIFAPQGIGKTTYALKVLHQVYKELGDRDPWGRALKMTFFDVEESIVLLKKANDMKVRIPAILYDDAGIWLEKYMWHNQNMLAFSRLYKLMRTLASCVIFTTPSEDDILKNVRDKSWYKVKIVRHGLTKDGKPLGLAKLFVYDVRKIGRQLTSTVKEKAIDQFTVRLPDEVYEKYQQIRREKGIEPQLQKLFEAFPKAKELLENEENEEGKRNQ